MEPEPCPVFVISPSRPHCGALKLAQVFAEVLNDKVQCNFCWVEEVSQ